VLGSTVVFRNQNKLLPSGFGEQEDFLLLTYVQLQPNLEIYHKVKNSEIRDSACGSREKSMARESEFVAGLSEQNFSPRTMILGNNVPFR
jgi:hypothetical protein